MKPLFPYFGGKSKVAAHVWEALGDCHYIEPFLGSAAVLLERPDWHKKKLSTVNDIDAFLSNCWRSLKNDFASVASWADYPVDECELHARHIWLLMQKEQLGIKLMADVDYYDPRAAGYWLYGMCCWIGGGFCSGKGPWWPDENGLLAKRNGDSGVGIWKTSPAITDSGVGIKRIMPSLGNAGRGINRSEFDLATMLDLYAEKLRNVRILCGDFERVLGNSVLNVSVVTGVFLDPPYDTTMRDNVYNNDEDNVAQRVNQWCISAPSTTRIVVAGYEGEHNNLESLGWTKYQWTASIGYRTLRKTGTNDNRYKESLWCNPACNPITGLKLAEVSNVSRD